MADKVKHPQSAPNATGKTNRHGVPPYSATTISPAQAAAPKRLGGLKSGTVSWGERLRLAAETNMEVVFERSFNELDKQMDSNATHKEVERKPVQEGGKPVLAAAKKIRDTPVISPEDKVVKTGSQYSDDHRSKRPKNDTTAVDQPSDSGAYGGSEKNSYKPGSSFSEDDTCKSLDDVKRKAIANKWVSPEFDKWLAEAPLDVSYAHFEQSIVSLFNCFEVCQKWLIASLKQANNDQIRAANAEKKASEFEEKLLNATLTINDLTSKLEKEQVLSDVAQEEINRLHNAQKYTREIVDAATHYKKKSFKLMGKVSKLEEKVSTCENDMLAKLSDACILAYQQGFAHGKGVSLENIPNVENIDWDVIGALFDPPQSAPALLGNPEQVKAERL